MIKWMKTFSTWLPFTINRTSILPTLLWLRNVGMSVLQEIWLWIWISLDIVWYFVRPCLSMIIGVCLVFDLMSSTIWSIPIVGPKVPQICPHTITVCRIPPIDSLALCWDPMGFGKNASVLNATNLLQTAADNHERVKKVDDTAYELSPLAKDMWTYRNALNKAKLVLEYSQIPRNKEMTAVFEELRDETMEVERKVSDLNHRAGTLAFEQFLSARSMAETLEMFTRSTSWFEKILRWLPLTSSQVRWLKQMFEPNGLDLLPEFVIQNINEQHAFLNEFYSRTQNVSNLIEHQQDLMRTIDRYTVRSKTELHRNDSMIVKDRGY